MHAAVSDNRERAPGFLSTPQRYRNELPQLYHAGTLRKWWPSAREMRQLLNVAQYHTMAHWSSPYETQVLGSLSSLTAHLQEGEVARHGVLVGLVSLHTPGCGGQPHQQRARALLRQHVGEPVRRTSHGRLDAGLEDGAVPNCATHPPRINPKKGSGRHAPSCFVTHLQNQRSLPDRLR